MCESPTLTLTREQVFGKFGSIQQIRVGTKDNTRGAAIVVYRDVLDAMDAVRDLSGFNVGGRYLRLAFFTPPRSVREEVTGTAAAAATTT